MNYWDSNLRDALYEIKYLAQAATILIKNEDQRRQEKHETEKKKNRLGI